ncbi:ribonuclease H-like domain-containing protein [Tanacetum coccineum]
MDQDSAHIVAASKVPMLKPGEFELWRMRIEQYIQMIEYLLWEVIENGATLPKTQLVEGVMTVIPITSAEHKAQRRLEVKARNTLMMGITNEHQLKFYSIKDDKLLLEAIEKRFGRNEATKKTQRNLLKQQYENFTAPSSEMLDQTLIGIKSFFDKSNVECYNCHKRGNFARECRAPRNQDNKKEVSRRSVPIETSTSTALVSCDGVIGYDWSYQARRA